MTALLTAPTGPTLPTGLPVPTGLTLLTGLPVLEPPVVEYPEDGSVRPVGRFVWEPRQTAQPPLLPSPLLHGRRVAILGGSDPTAATLAAALTAAGAVPLRVPAEPAALAAFCAAAGRIDGIVDLNLDDPFDVTGPAGWERPLQQSFALLQSVYADWVAESDATRVFYLAVTRMGGRMGFDGDSVGQPLGGLWAGLAKGLTREIPNCNVRVLDLSRDHEPDLAALVTRELYRWGLFEVGYRDGRRFTLVARPTPVGPVARTLSPGDVVVMSGGGRGIGFALARSLAGRFGCRVIVSGRAAAPNPADPIMSLDDAGFRALRDDRLRQAAALRRVPAARAELESLAQARELARNLGGAQAQGLRIEYVRCDICDPRDVARLVAAAGDRLVGVVHNAGVDVPTRLPGKTAGVVTTVVRVKLQGFFNLVDAVQNRPGLAFFCNVGSLTGRWGGMVGQLDYGAANEGLSRAGLWAAARDGRHPLPVTTVCWPTWERLGMITNYEATLQYMSAVDVNEGLYHWQREILSAGTGEVTFVGEIGAAMSPAVLRGYQQDADLPAIDRIVSSRFFLGTPLRFQPSRSITSVNDLSTTAMPCCEDFRVDGVPALPVSFCLAYLLSAGDWVRPEPAGNLVLTGMRDVGIELGALKAPADGRLRLVKEATGRWHEGAWRVQVGLSRDGEPLAAAELLYHPAPSAAGQVTEQAAGQAAEQIAGRVAELAAGSAASAFLAPHVLAPDAAAVAMPPGGRLTWRGQVFRLAGWYRHPISGRVWGRAERDQVRDLLTVSPSPRVAVPLNQLESILRAAHHEQVLAHGTAARPTTAQPTVGRTTIGPAPISPLTIGRLTIGRLTIGRLSFAPEADSDGVLIGTADGREWTGFTDDRARRLRLRLDDLRFR